ncbi:UNVERIFIED_CONTAM: hypothetical protein Sangu_2192200 [Sesamum angustifolium]|uniref:C2 NT-type domain-containing protein n=1 Tax=Sesamum angustifolium TaxID=2727405 RepID=A0AAW2LF84_9LAMI
MFKRSEKKIKAVFKMQFQATQVPQLKSKSLMISLVPVDVGKPTVRLAKVPIVEGTCTWENPVYETVKLVKEIKTGRIREKFYYVIVSTGSSKSGFLGEVSIDFADLAEATKPLNLTLPLQTSKSGAILHVGVQRMQGGPGSRYNEESEAPVDESCDQNSDAETKDSYGSGKRNPRSAESDDLSEETSLHDEQNGSLEDAESRDGVEEASNGTGRSTNQMKMLERKAELSELEVQSLRKQVMRETRRGQQLSEQIVCLKEERDAIKEECERLKSSSTCKNAETVSSHIHKETETVRSSLESIKQELQREKQLNKKLKLQLQKTEDSNSEFVLAMRDLSKKLEQKNTEISRLSSKIKALHSGSETPAASPRTKMNQNEESKATEDLASKNGNADEAEMMKQKIENLYAEIEVHKKEKAEIRMDVERLTLDYESLEMEYKDIYSKLEQNEKEKMDMQHNYTESLAAVKQFKVRAASLEEENKRHALQYSESLNMIDELEFQVDSLQKELEKQAQVFEEDLEAVTRAKVEQEQRAIRAEEALRKTRRNNANAAERLQEEFKQISAEMSLKIEENEKLAQKAVSEANNLRQNNDVLEELLQKAKDELQMIKDQYERLLQQRPEQNAGSSEMGDHRKNILRDESEQMKTNIEESEMSKRWKLEKEDLERQVASMRKEAEKLKHENISMKSQIDQKKTKEENLHLEVKKLRLKNNEVKNHLLELEMEKEGLKKEMSKLQSGLRKKEQGREKAVLQDSVASTVKEKRGSEDLSLEKNGQSVGNCNASSLSSEVASLKERNKSMEEELREMHERYSEISLRFAEVEGERQQLVMALRNLKSGKKN